MLLREKHHKSECFTPCPLLTQQNKKNYTATDNYLLYTKKFTFLLSYYLYKVIT